MLKGQYPAGYFSDMWRLARKGGYQNQWVWISGSNQKDQSGIWTSKGTWSNNGNPGARRFAQGSSRMETTTYGFYLFGGTGIDSNGNVGFMNDLWTWNTEKWAWMSGSSISNQQPTGTKGSTSASNSPGGRERAWVWADKNNRNFWVFGGFGVGNGGSVGSYLYSFKC